MKIKKKIAWLKDVITNSSALSRKQAKTVFQAIASRREVRTQRLKKP